MSVELVLGFFARKLQYPNSFVWEEKILYEIWRRYNPLMRNAFKILLCSTPIPLTSVDMYVVDSMVEESVFLSLPSLNKNLTSHCFK